MNNCVHDSRAQSTLGGRRQAPASTRLTMCSGLAVTSPFATKAFNVVDPLTMPRVYPINAGGPSFTSRTGVQWIGDGYFNTGSTITKVVPIANTVDDTLYQAFR